MYVYNNIQYDFSITTIGFSHRLNNNKLFFIIIKFIIIKSMAFPKLKTNYLRFSSILRVSSSYLMQPCLGKSHKR